jgi:hypothetical protein
MCIDFTYLNKACKKDPFSLPRINASVDKAAACRRFSLLDCFSSYHQIWLKKEDQEKTSFTTSFGTYCYVRMPEGLKNVGSTFARMTVAMLGKQFLTNKCVFGVSKGKMLGYVISSEGIQANPDKTKAIMSMVEPSTKKEVQRLTGRIVALNRFISKSAERSLPFFKVLKGGGDSQWETE